MPAKGFILVALISLQNDAWLHRRAQMRLSHKEFYRKHEVSEPDRIRMPQRFSWRCPLLGDVVRLRTLSWQSRKGAAHGEIILRP